MYFSIQQQVDKSLATVLLPDPWLPISTVTFLVFILPFFTGPKFSIVNSISFTFYRKYTQFCRYFYKIKKTTAVYPTVVLYSKYLTSQSLIRQSAFGIGRIFR